MRALKKFFCWMGWHKVQIVGFVPLRLDLYEGRCLWCGKRGSVDAMGRFV